MTPLVMERARDAVALTGLGTVCAKPDKRRKRDPERIMREAVMLRKRGLTWKEISPHVGASPSWLSLYCPPELRCLTNNELADRRSAYQWARAKAAALKLDSRVARGRMAEFEREWREREARLREQKRELRAAANLIEARAMAWLEREWRQHIRAYEAQIRLIEARAMVRLEREWRQHIRLHRKEAREREKAARREARVQERHMRRIRRYERGWESYKPTRPTMIRLDAPASSEIDTPRHELFAPLHNAFDPQTWLEAELLDELVGELSIADIQRMTDEQLRPLRERLIAEGFASRSVQDKERERLRVPARHRGEAPSVTFERMAPRHRGRREQQELMAGKRTSRKQRGRWDREADSYDWKAAA